MNRKKAFKSLVNEHVACVQHYRHACTHIHNHNSDHKGFLLTSNLFYKINAMKMKIGTESSMII